MKVKRAVLAGVSSRTITMYNNSVCIDAVPEIIYVSWQMNRPHIVPNAAASLSFSLLPVLPVLPVILTVLP